MPILSICWYAYFDNLLICLTLVYLLNLLIYFIFSYLVNLLICLFSQFAGTPYFYVFSQFNDMPIKLFYINFYYLVNLLMCLIFYLFSYFADILVINGQTLSFQSKGRLDFFFQTLLLLNIQIKHFLLDMLTE